MKKKKEETFQKEMTKQRQKDVNIGRHILGRRKKQKKKREFTKIHGQPAETDVNYFVLQKSRVRSFGFSPREYCPPPPLPPFPLLIFPTHEVIVIPPSLSPLFDSATSHKNYLYIKIQNKKQQKNVIPCSLRFVIVYLKAI